MLSQSIWQAPSLSVTHTHTFNDNPIYFIGNQGLKFQSQRAMAKVASQRSWQPQQSQQGNRPARPKQNARQKPRRKPKGNLAESPMQQQPKRKRRQKWSKKSWKMTRTTCTPGCTMNIADVAKTKSRQGLHSIKVTSMRFTSDSIFTSCFLFFCLTGSSSSSKSDCRHALNGSCWGPLKGTTDPNLTGVWGSLWKRNHAASCSWCVRGHPAPPTELLSSRIWQPWKFGELMILTYTRWGLLQDELMQIIWLTRI